MSLTWRPDWAGEGHRLRGGLQSAPILTVTHQKAFVDVLPPGLGMVLWSAGIDC